MRPQIDISGYLLGELSGDELEEAERLMREDPDLRAEVERLRPAVARLETLPAAAWEQPKPPPLDLSDPDTPQSGAEAAPREQSHHWWRGRMALPRLGLALASLALVAIGLGGGLLLADGGGDGLEPSATLALEPVEPRDDGASGSVEVVGTAGGEMLVDISGARANGPDDFYELWLLSSPDDLISLGSFHVGETGSATVSVPLPVDPKQFEFVDLSLERDDGDSSHSGRSILRAKT